MNDAENQFPPMTFREWWEDKVVSRVWWWKQLIVRGPMAMVREAEELSYELGRHKGKIEGFEEAMVLWQDSATAHIEMESALLRARAEMDDEEE